MPVNGNFHIVEIQSPCTVIVILDHTADWNIQSQFFQHLQTDIYLAASAIHHNDIREACKTSDFLWHIFFFQFFLFLHAVRKPPGQNLMHGSVIIRPRYRTEFEFPVIAPLWPSFFVYNHGTDGFKSVDIGNIVSLHTV